MKEFFSHITKFTIKTLIIVLAILVAVGGSLFMSRKAVISVMREGRRTIKSTSDNIEIKYLNDKYLSIMKTLNKSILDDNAFEVWEKEQKKNEKQKGIRPRVFVLDFVNDDIDKLREEITAVILVAAPNDEVIIRLSSGGGPIYQFGLGAAQLQRLKERQITLTVTVDEAAVSGGYMMACIADNLYCAPFAEIGAIGVIRETMNYNRFLEKLGIDYELFTAGKYKRLVTTHGKTTEEAREKEREKLSETHRLFKELVLNHRPQADLDKIATGENWDGICALDLKLVDKLITSDELLLERIKTADVYQLNYRERNFRSSSFMEDKDQFLSTMQSIIRRILYKIMSIVNSIETVPDTDLKS